ncbi:MAG TPA: TolC family protein [Thermodesulfobacteriota bacterium]|nr:TolC family protein [Thermodesulfobacteriota bacterium]
MSGSRTVILYSAVILSLLILSCANGLPELNPYKEASSAPGVEWKPSEQELQKSFQLEELPEVPEELKPDSNKLALSQLVDVALINNPTTQVAWEDARAAAAAWAEARGLYYPHIAGTSRYAYAKGGGSAQGTDPYKEQYGDIGLTLNYLLFDFGGREAQIDAARLALINANWNQNQAIQNVLQAVAVSFYDYIGSKALVIADEASLKDAETSLDAAKLRLEAGVGTLPDVLQAQAQLAQVQLDLVDAKGNVEIDRGLLATAVGWPANTEFDVDGNISDLPVKAVSDNVNNLIALAMKNRPDLAAVQATVRQREALLWEAKSKFFPEIAATAQVLRWWVRPEGDSSEFFTDYLVGLQIQMPIFQGFQILNSVRKAKAQLESARSALELQEQIVINQVWNSYYNFTTAVESLQAADSLVASAQESYNASLARFKSGVGDIVELLNAQATLAQARSEQVQSKTAIFTSYANLINAIGTDLPTQGMPQEPSPAEEGGKNQDEPK